jgi:glycosyltransferase involved in cell wall biosynthesis
VRHFVLTRSSYGPGWDPEANRRRLAITRGITVRSLAAQTNRDWELVVLLDDDDPLRAERLRVFEGTAVPVRVICWQGQATAFAPWDKRARFYAGQHADEFEARFWKDKVAATAYRVDWAGAIDSADGDVIMGRLDDDDALAPTVLERVRAAAEGQTRRVALMHPNGFRVWRGRYSRVRHETNAMHSLFTPTGDAMTVYDYGHRRVADAAPVVMVDELPAWLWVRHRDTISGWKKGERPISSGLRRIFPVDWPLLERAA